MGDKGEAGESDNQLGDGFTVVSVGTRRQAANGRRHHRPIPHLVGAHDPLGFTDPLPVAAGSLGTPTAPATPGDRLGFADPFPARPAAPARQRSVLARDPYVPAAPGSGPVPVVVDAPGGLGPWPALTVATLAFFLAVADMSAVNVGFPSLAAEFGGSTTAASWVVSGYNVTVGALLLSAGRLADSIGRKRVFVPGVGLFLAGSVAAGAAPALAWLIAARVVQGAGSAAIAATALAVVLPTVPRHRRSLAIGIAGAVGSLGAVAGPALASLAIEVWSWRGIFLLNVPVGLVVLALAPRLLSESRDPGAGSRIDQLGVILGAGAVAAVMLAIVVSTEPGVGPILSLSLLIVGAVGSVAVIGRSRRHPAPVVALDLLAVPSFRSVNVAVAAWSLGFASGFLANSLFLQRHWNLPIATVGKVLVVSPLVAALVSPLAGRLADRVGHRWILATGCALCAVGYGALQFAVADDPQVWTRFAPITAIIGAGVGATVAGWPAAALSDVEPHRFGTADATVRTTQQVCYALGIAVVVTLLAAPEGAGLLAHRQAWSFIALMFGCAAVVIAATFPAGADRRMVGPTTPTPTSPATPTDRPAGSAGAGATGGDSGVEGPLADAPALVG